jgi:hypothetical protein
MTVGFTNMRIPLWCLQTLLEVVLTLFSVIWLAYIMIYKREYRRGNPKRITQEKLATTIK